MDPVWFVFAGMGAVGAGLMARSLARRPDAPEGSGDAPPRAPSEPPAPSVPSISTSAPASDGAPPSAATPPPAAVSVPPAVVSMPPEALDSVVPPATTKSEDDAMEDPTGPIALILVTALGLTDQGRHRTTNEDSFLVDTKRHLFAICDGMGGHAAGEVASQLAIETIARAHRTGQFDGEPDPTRARRGDRLVRAIAMANRAVYTKAREDGRYHGMGTTAVAASFSPNKQRVYIAHVGDSRCYRVRDGKLRQITKDHTLGSLGVQGPAAGKLVRAVGTETHVEIDLFTDAPEAGDYYMLCSDGLTRMVPNAEIERIITGERDLDRAVAALIAAANEAGGRDNITVILVRVDEAA